jgi:L-iditol 2-dehydrogenase
MRAVVLHGREDARLESVALRPLGAGEVVVRTGAALTCGTDVKVFRRGYHARMIVPPSVFGHEMAGFVEEVGEGVETVRVGDAVVVVNSAPCGTCAPCRAGREALCDDLLFWNGAYAEKTVVPARIVRKNLLPVPEGLRLEHAALVEPLACAVRAIEDCAVDGGQTVAVIGVGPLGLLLVGLAASKGAAVLAVGRRVDRLRRATAFGAAATISTLDDAFRRLKAEGGGRGPDVVIDAVGIPQTAQLALDAVGKGGTVDLFGGCEQGTTLALDAPRVHYEEITVRGTFHHTPASVRAALALLQAGALPVDELLSGEAGLEDVPRLLATMAGGEGDRKAVIRP